MRDLTFSYIYGLYFYFNLFFNYYFTLVYCRVADLQFYFYPASAAQGYNKIVKLSSWVDLQLFPSIQPAFI